MAQKLFVIKKYIYADSATEALQKEKHHLADDCWVDEDWKRNHLIERTPAIGFRLDDKEEKDEY
jgi:hypothetical protein